MLLFPSDPVRPRRVDDHVAPEAEAARDLDIPYALIDHYAVPRDPAAAVRRVPEGTALYRGRMLRSADYAAFERALSARGATLRTTADRGRHPHGVRHGTAAPRGRPRGYTKSLKHHRTKRAHPGPAARPGA